MPMRKNTPYVALSDRSKRASVSSENVASKPLNATSDTKVASSSRRRSLVVGTLPDVRVAAVGSIVLDATIAAGASRAGGGRRRAR